MTSAQFSVSSRMEGSAAVIYPKGYLNSLAGENLVKECSAHTGRGITKIVVNLGGIDLINSIGISLILQIVEDLRSIKGTICCTDMSRFLQDTFEMLGLLQHILVFKSENEALQYLRAECE